MSTGIDYTYRYAYASSFDRTASEAELNLATCSRKQEHPYFFEGRMRRPRETANMLLVLSEVVRTHFFLPRPPLLDPVLTGSESMLRLEGFSGCCGVYARVDLPAEAFEGDIKGRGTTNVDFNDPMRAALLKIRDTDDVRFAVGKEEVALATGGERVVEKKVKLPVRWVKGFSEVQAYQPALTLRHEAPADEAIRFFRSLPVAGIPKRPSYVVQMGSTIRLSHRPKPAAVTLHGTHRIKILEPLLATANHLRIWADQATGTSAWEVVSDAGRFFLMVSPEVYRGFSGEGQVLQTLAAGVDESLIDYIRGRLNWQPTIDHQAIAAELNTDPARVEAALAVLGTRGLAGFDASSGHYFHRELPFDLEQVEKLQPRLKAARRLVDEGNIRLHHTIDASRVDLLVQGTEVEHVVRLRPDDDRCTCRWFSRYQGQRGPCKHILASRLWFEAEMES